MGVLAEEIVPDKLAKFKEMIDEHQRIFEAKLKKSVNSKVDATGKVAKEGEKKAEKLQKGMAQL